MADCKSAELKKRAIIKVTGPDSKDFLTGLLTNDIDGTTLPETGSGPHTVVPSCFAGLLTPQGKILFDFIVAKSDDGYFIDVDAASAEDLVKRLTFYKLRADVEISLLGAPHRLYAIWGGSDVQVSSGICFADPRLPELGWRCVIENENSISATCEPLEEMDFHTHRIKLGIPEGGKDYAFGDTFPHEACYDQINGVDFKKGCFVGQEVVSRMQHRGTARKRIISVSAEEELPAQGFEITANGKPIGTLGSSSGSDGIALIRLDRAARALENEQQIMTGGITLSLKVPTWADYLIE